MITLLVDPSEHMITFFSNVQQQSNPLQFNLSGKIDGLLMHEHINKSNNINIFIK